MPIDIRRMLVGFLMLVLVVGIAACGSRAPQEGDASEAPPVEDEAIDAFEPVVAILEASCTTAACHSASRAAGDLVLSSDVAEANLVNVPSSQQDGATLVIPGDAEGSYLMAKLRGDDAIRGSRMPIGDAPLSEEEMGIIAEWIAGIPTE
ncbi:MAG TPA: hypothetical protein GX714_05005 [Chloroflexi bacterium]|jgi:hypothetical protein|nr:hypothetical protein [Chloroflexota bacterium]